MDLVVELDQVDRENRACFGLLTTMGMTKAAFGRVLLHTHRQLLRAFSSKTL